MTNQMTETTTVLRAGRLPRLRDSNDIVQECTVVLLVALGLVAMVFGLLTAASGLGLPVLIHAPFLVLWGFALTRSKRRLAVISFMLACWAFSGLLLIIGL